MDHYTGTYTVSLSLPDCEAEKNDLIGAVRSFQAQASQPDLFAYIVEQESAPHKRFLVDMADYSIKEM